MTPAEIEAGKAPALIAYASALTGLPLWLVPFMMPDNRFAMAHARYAGTAWILGMIVSVAWFMLVFITCGLAWPLVGALFLLWVPNIAGAVNAANGSVEAPIGLFGLDLLLFGPFDPGTPPPPPSSPGSKEAPRDAASRGWLP